MSRAPLKLSSKAPPPPRSHSPLTHSSRRLVAAPLPPFLPFSAAASPISKAVLTRRARGERGRQRVSFARPPPPMGSFSTERGEEKEGERAKMLRCRKKGEEGRRVQERSLKEGGRPKA